MSIQTPTITNVYICDMSAGSDVSGRERMGISLMNVLRIEIWDVLCLFSFLLMHCLVGLRHAWPITALACGISSIERDMLIHEIAAAAFMLRHACGAARVTLGPTFLITFFSVALAVCAHSSKYLSLHFTYRRSVVLCAMACSTLLLHGTSDPQWLSITRLVGFVCLTRYDTTSMHLDPWDSTAQKVWLLIIPCEGIWLSPLYYLLYCKSTHCVPTANRRRRDYFYIDTSKKYTDECQV